MAKFSANDRVVSTIDGDTGTVLIGCIDADDPIWGRSAGKVLVAWDGAAERVPADAEDLRSADDEGA